jgi:predicted nucleic acid-binding protein
MASDAIVEMSAVAWYEFCRGPRTPEQTAAARALFEDEGIIAFDERLAERAREEFRKAGSPRSRAADIAIGVTAASRDATLLTRNRNDFDGIEGLALEVISSD